MTKLSILTTLVLFACVQPTHAADDHAGHDHAAHEETRVPPPPRMTVSPDLLKHTANLAHTVRQIEARRLLNAEEGKQFDALFGKLVRSPEENKVLDDLTQTGMKRLAEYLGLNAKAPKTEAEVARMRELDALAQANAAVVKRLQQGSARLSSADIAPPAADESTRQMYATLIEQNKRIIAQNDQIIALLTQMAARPVAATAPAPQPANQ